MKNNFIKFIYMVLFAVAPILVSAQTTSVTVDWTGGHCTVCSGNYACSSGYGNWLGGNKTFTDPIPSGNVITNISVRINQVDCGFTSATASVNGAAVGSYGATGNCSCSACFPKTVNGASAALLNAYNYGGSNTLNLSSNGEMCVDNAVITFTYEPSCAEPDVPSSPFVTSFAGRTFTVNNASVDGGGNTGVVAPGASYTVSFDWVSTYTSTYCPGCVQQFYWGVGGQENWDCLFSGNTSSTRSGSRSVTRTAPTAPGYYYFSTGSGLQFSCTGSSNTAADCSNVFGWIEVGDPTKPTVSLASSTNITCEGGSDGAIDISVTGGQSPYTYSWTGPNGFTASTEDVSGLDAGSYTVTVHHTCNANCSEELTVNITEPSAFNITMSSAPVTCPGGSDGRIKGTIDAFSGTPPYTWVWSDGASGTGNNGVQPANRPAGTYTITFTDAAGCTVSGSTTVTQPSAFNITMSSAPVTCPGGSDGRIKGTIDAFSGTAPYTWVWSDGASGTGNNGVQPANRPAGTYTITFTDAAGCTVSGSTTVTQPSAFNITMSSAPVTCPGGSDGRIKGTIDAFSGTAPYTWVWSDGASGTGNNGVQPANRPAGTYTITFTDAAGCTVSGSTTVTQPSAFNITMSSAPVTCPGGSDGRIKGTIDAFSGTAPYTWVWSSGESGTGNNGVLPPTKPAGTYTITFTDAAGCTVSGSTTVTQPSAFNINMFSSPVSCFGGSDGRIKGTIDAFSGTAPYTWVWSSGESGTGNNGALPPIKPAGTYTITFTDAAGCTVSGSTTVTQPTQLTTSLSAATFAGGWNISCNGASDGSITNTVGGATPPYTYSWSNGATTKDVSGLTAGTYTVTVTDDNGCVETATATLTEPATFEFALSTSQYNCGSQVSCNGGSDGQALVSSISGGTMPYVYSWSNGVTTKDNLNVGAGTYTLNATDANGCTFSASVTLTEPSAVVASMDAPPVYNCGYNVSCNGFNDGSASVSVSGGCPPYTYAWSDGQTTAAASNLPAGTHTVSVTDNNGCNQSLSVTLTEPDALTISMSPSDTLIDCVPADWTIVATPSGGCAPYSYFWADSSTNDNITVNPNETTVYDVIVTDDNGCVAGPSEGGATTVTVINRCGQHNHKSLICHIPNGNHQNPQTICISPNALNPHLNHLWDLHGGDYCGPCVNKALPVFAEDSKDPDANKVYVSAYPNPFTNIATIEFSIARTSNVNITVYSVDGRVVATLFNGELEAGVVNAVEFESNALPAGVYIYKLSTETNSVHDKITLIK